MRLLISLFLTLCLLACAQAKKDPYSANDLLNTLNVSVRTSYEQDKTILLYAYEDSVENSEAYADWAAYLNDFSEIKSDQLDAVRVSRLDFEQEMISFLDDTENNFTLFLKKDMPIYYYEGLILEPQVYTAINRVHKTLELNDEHKAFLPTKVKFEAP